MKQLLIILVLSSIGLINSACKTDSDYDIGDYYQNCYAKTLYVNAASLYIAGYCANAAVFWKDGVLTDQTTFTSGMTNGQSVQLGTDTYYQDNGVIKIYSGKIGANPYYTVDEESIAFLDSPAAGSVDSIYVTPNSIYAAGTYGYLGGCDNFYYDNCYYPYKACFWKNGTRMDLLNIDESYYINGIQESNGAIIVTGNQYLGFAFYWHNDEFKQLTTIDKISGAFGIHIANNDVYIAGYYNNQNIFPVACYWKNAIRTDLEFNTYSKAYGVYVSLNDVYTAGYYIKNGDPIPCYWLNANRFDLPAK